MTNDTLLRQQTTTDLKKQVTTLVIWAQKSILLLYWIVQFSFANRRICLHNELINSSINPLVLSLQRRSMATNLLVCFQTFRSNDSMMTVSTTTTNYYYKLSAIISTQVMKIDAIILTFMITIQWNYSTLKKDVARNSKKRWETLVKFMNFAPHFSAKEGREKERETLHEIR